MSVKNNIVSLVISTFIFSRKKNRQIVQKLVTHRDIVIMSGIQISGKYLTETKEHDEEDCDFGVHFDNYNHCRNHYIFST